MPPRCFLAVPLPPQARGLLARVRADFVAAAPQWAGEKWVPAANLHVTIAFLGALDDLALPAYVSEMRERAALRPAFTMRLAGVEPVPSLARATMLWVTLDDPESGFPALRLALAGDADTRTLRPHITLARARAPKAVDAAALGSAASTVAGAGKEPDGIVSVTSVTLFSSTLRASGPEYREIAVARFRDASGTD